MSEHTPPISMEGKLVHVPADGIEFPCGCRLIFDTVLRIEYCPLHAAAPDLLAALEGMLEPDNLDIVFTDYGSLHKYECRHCQRWYDDEELECCPSDDCPGHIARAAIAKAKGAPNGQ